MTVKELYEWAIENHVEEYDLLVTDFSGTSTLWIQPEINHNIRTVEL